MINKPLTLLVLLVVFSPVSALAAGGEGASVASLLWPLINFLIFASLIRYLYKKHVAGLLKARSVSIEEYLGRSKSELLKAEEEYNSLCEKLRDIDADKREIFARFDTEGSKLSKVILENANDLAKRLEADAKRQIDSELNQETRKLKQEAIKLAIDAAQVKLAQELTPEQDKALRAEALSGLVSEKTSEELRA